MQQGQGAYQSQGYGGGAPASFAQFHGAQQQQQGLYDQQYPPAGQQPYQPPADQRYQGQGWAQ